MEVYCRYLYDSHATTYKILLLLVAINSVSYAQIQKWVDEDGKVHYGSYSPSEYKSETVENAPVTTVYGTSKVDLPKGQVQGEQAPSFISSAAPVGQAVLFTTSWCGYCKRARAYMADNRISFTEYDIERDQRARTEFLRYGDKAVPLLVMGKKHVRGFNDKRYNNFFR